MKDEVKIILDICDKILLKNVDHHLRLNLEPNSTQFKTLKNEIISSELTKLLVKEDLGGAGMTLTDIIPIVQLSAQYGTPIPFIETIISNFLLSELNIKAENDFITLTNKTENILIKKDKISGNFKSIPYLNLAEKILVETEIKNQKLIILFKKGGKLKLQKNFLSEPKFDLDASELETLKRSLIDFYQSKNFQLTYPSLVEFADAIGGTQNSSLRESAFTFFDDLSSNELAIRPDISQQIARIDQAEESEKEQRYCYVGEVLKKRKDSFSRSRITIKAGVEIFGGGDNKYEVLSLLSDSVKIGNLNELTLSFGKTEIFYMSTFVKIQNQFNVTSLVA